MLDAVVDRLVNELSVGPGEQMRPTDGWQAFLQWMAHEVRNLARDHPTLSRAPHRHPRRRGSGRRFAACASCSKSSTDSLLVASVATWVTSQPSCVFGRSSPRTTRRPSSEAALETLERMDQNLSQ
ncbi:hypothetical protein N798_15140 [Knoellia flava TL1]|nr:hypothetical protein N798_15140 [Knoellia flava TL1]